MKRLQALNSGACVCVCSCPSRSPSRFDRSSSGDRRRRHGRGACRGDPANTRLGGARVGSPPVPRHKGDWPAQISWTAPPRRDSMDHPRTPCHSFGPRGLAGLPYAARALYRRRGGSGWHSSDRVSEPETKTVLPACWKFPGFFFFFSVVRGVLLSHDARTLAVVRRGRLFSRPHLTEILGAG